ncbi:MAG: peptidoglycan DD-metalloendopeptidase family protein [Proteobacteria bacterium]|nr:peptidoglycan DD-metalloendopeptidase family protein [Pseudomonadota bacterium]MBI3497952.1 peptidoglycan DD-metalloendopeptidase family protein [Pseudomonadota bacterium]
MQFPKILSFCLGTAFLTIAPAVYLPASAGFFDWAPLEQVLSLSRDTQPANQSPSAGSGGSLTVVQELTLGQGDTLLKVLLAAGVNREAATRAIEAAQDFVDLRRLNVGTVVTLTLNEAGESPELVAVHLEVQPELSLTLVRAGDGGFRAAQVNGKPSLMVERVTGEIATSFRGSLISAGVPARIAGEVIQGFDHDPTLPKRVARGTSFEVIYERLAVASRRQADRIQLRYATLTTQGKQHQVYRYAPRDGEPKFLDGEGRVLNETHFITPISGGKVSSGYGMRMHPVLGDRRMHRGVDYRAPRGTPVLAAAEGVIEDMGWRGNYGLYIRIGHGERYATTYAHLDSFAPGITEGSRIRQGQAIAKVGHSGLATGDHLYFELLVDNQRVNPTTARINARERLQGADLARFRAFVRQIHVQLGEAN